MTIIKLEQTWRRNIFLDFMNPDVRRVAGVFSKFDKIQHIQEILRGIKVACLLGDKLILPPSFVLQCPFVRTSLQYCQILLYTNIILFPMRESDPQIFYEKKTKQYEPVKEYYKDIHENVGLRVIKKHQDLFIQRKAPMGKTISNYWLGGNLPTIKWGVLQEKIPRRYDELRELPKRLVEENIAVTAPAIQDIAGGEVLGVRDEIDLILQGIHGFIYINEFEAAVIQKLPIQPWDFGLLHGNQAYNYHIFEEVLNILKIFKALINLNFDDIYSLRSRNGFLKFLKSYILLSSVLKKDDLFLTFSDALKNTEAKVKKTSAYISNFFLKLKFSTSTIVDALDDFLFEISDYLFSCYQDILRVSYFSEENSIYLPPDNRFEQSERSSDRSILKKTMKQGAYTIVSNNRGKNMRIMIFSALEEELVYLRKDLGLKNPINKHFEWTHNSKDMYFNSLIKLDSGKELEIFLVTPDEAGLVPTAILASHIKSIIKPDFAFMIGICGGRSSEGIRLADIIMPYNSFLYHYGAYAEGKLIPEIRSEKIGKKISSWATTILNEELLENIFKDFPEGSNKPRTISKIRKEPMGCGDLLVKDVSIIDEARELDRKLIGVDMESYSFIRAISEENKTLVIKAVTDYADADKDDSVRDYCKYITARCVLALIQNIQTAPMDG